LDLARWLSLPLFFLNYLLVVKPQQPVVLQEAVAVTSSRTSLVLQAVEVVAAA
jgi:hypothetical protein